MSNWTSPYLTQKGQQLLAKAEAGKLLNFTRLKAGDGSATEIETLTDLVSPKQALGITAIEVTEDKQCKVSANMTNTGLGEGYYVSELGLFAKDPDDNREYLFAYSKDTAADYMPAEGGAAAIAIEFNYFIGIGNASNVTAVVDTSKFATVETLKQYIVTIDKDGNEASYGHGVTFLE